MNLDILQKSKLFEELRLNSSIYLVGLAGALGQRPVVGTYADVYLYIFGIKDTLETYYSLVDIDEDDSASDAATGWWRNPTFVELLFQVVDTSYVNKMKAHIQRWYPDTWETKFNYIFDDDDFIAKISSFRAKKRLTQMRTLPMFSQDVHDVAATRMKAIYI